MAAAADGNVVLPEALLFDCDGVLVDTERDGHRVSFNEAFDEVSKNPEENVLDGSPSGKVKGIIAVPTSRPFPQKI